MPYGYKQSRISRAPYPPIKEGACCHRGPRPSQFRERGALDHLSFLGPHAGVTYFAVCPKNGHSGTILLQILLCPENFLIKHILKKSCSLKMYFVAPNLKTWLRACPFSEPASNIASLERISLYGSRHA